jgi:hypothetical protein
MGRKMDNPEIVHELINGMRTMGQWKFEYLYSQLSKRDMQIVSDAITRMGKQDEMEFVYGHYDYPL